MSQNLQRISVSVDKDEYEELKNLLRVLLLIGLLNADNHQDLQIH